MKKLRLTITLLTFASIVNAQQLQTKEQNSISPSSIDQAPFMQQNDLEANKATWTVQLLSDITTSSGSNGYAGITFLNNQFWVSKWGSDTLARFTNTGAFVDKFVIAGITGVRCITTDGSLLYMGNNTTTISVVNPTTLTSTGTITTTNTVRFLSYDPTLNSNAGGFWMGNFSANIDAISMTGTILSSIPSATHTLTGMYGAAIDNVSEGGPYLWVHNQGGANSDQFVALQLPAGTPTTHVHDVFPDLSSLGVTSTLAGGAFVTSNLVPGQISLIGLTQSTAVNSIIAYELSISTAGITDNNQDNLAVYPNPATDFLTIQTHVSNGATVQIIDMTGSILSQQVVESTATEITLATDQLSAGIYFVELIQGDVKTSTRIIKQ